MCKKIKIGISTCLLGEPVRYDGGHKLDRYLRDTLGRYLEYVPVCPETEAGYPVPRRTFRLEGDPGAPRLITPHDGVDHTERMQQWAKKRVAELEAEELCGFIFKSKSPNSGMERVKVFAADGQAVRKGVGIFARIFMDAFPLLPTEDEGRLHDPGLRENFIERIFAMKRWRELLRQGVSRASLVEFHTTHKLLIMSHNVEEYRRLGQLVATVAERPLEATFEAYEQGFLGCLRELATREKHTNVLQHVAGYFKRSISADERRELGEWIERYRLGQATLSIPVTLLNHHVRKVGEAYLQKQVYLAPHPLELQLRNHA